MAEIAVTHLKSLPSPFIEDKFEEHIAKKGAQADTALSHLMKILYLRVGYADAS